MPSNEEATLSDATDGEKIQDRTVGLKARTLRIRVLDDSQDGRPAVNIRMPIGVVKFGMKMAEVFSPEARTVNLHWDDIAGLIDEGDLGKIVDVEDEAQHKTIEIWIE
jgi:hypothetical protein